MFYNDSQKLETTSTGISVTGNVFVNRDGTNGTVASPYFENIIESGISSTNLSAIQLGNSFGQDSGTLLRFRVNSGAGSSSPINALTIDGSGNSTFAGNVKIEDTIEITDATATRGKIEFIDSSGLVSLTESLQIANTKNVQFIGSGGDHARITYTQGNGTTGDVWSHSFYQNSGFQASMEFFASTEAAGDGNIRFKTAATERMTITSGGDVLFGTQGTPNGTSVYHYKHILKIKHLAESILLQVIYGF